MGNCLPVAQSSEGRVKTGGVAVGWIGAQAAILGLDLSPQLATALQALVVGAGVWLLKRAIGQVDKKLDTLAVQAEQSSRKDGEHDACLAELRVRATNAERQIDRLVVHVDDLGGFLRDQGFRKRDGVAP